MRLAQCFWSTLLPLLLAACATASLPSAHVHSSHTPVPAAVPATSHSASVRPDADPRSPSSPTDAWAQLRADFAMEDCAADPKVLALARSYTRSPAGFEARMRAVLPQLVYVQESAARHDVAGEFALLPWVESHYRQTPAERKSRPAGIWQLMPATAGAMGLRVNPAYDGRLDLAASTEGVMRLLHRYHARYGDWALVDHAYNAGEFAMRQRNGLSTRPSKASRKHTARSAVATREHLLKLMAIACIVREPARFHVSLPSLPAGQRLVEVTVDRSMPLAQAALHAGMSATALRVLNAAFRNNVLDTRYADHLLLPTSRAAQFRDAMEAVATAGRADHAERAASDARFTPQ